MTSDHESGDTMSPRAAAIRELLNEWDFIGVVPDGILDEYDCLIAPISERLSRGAGSDELYTFLDTELPDHFGLGGGRSPASERFVARVLRLRE
ncbi:hypothetical protein ACQPWY_27155 [Pseudonocardia xinjiangensis]|uniref:hypothetical protein n=1 Tax=Pseudonocardia xinjiangensis TaxID=75289 RepID=UPI003D8E05CC